MKVKLRLGGMLRRYAHGQARGELFRLHDGAEVGFFPPIGGG